MNKSDGQYVARWTEHDSDDVWVTSTPRATVEAARADGRTLHSTYALPRFAWMDVIPADADPMTYEHPSYDY